MKLPEKLFAISLISVIIFSLLVFLFKAEWLTIGIGRSLPVGTLVSWLLVVAFAAVMLLLFNRKAENRVKRFLTATLKINIALAAVWGFVSFLLSGNWSFNFSGGIRFNVWIYYTAFVIAIPLVVFVSWGAILLIRKIFSSK
ncbi:MAG TPA: hypothetical protein DER09_04615 [Prolixibacteraceae bacterium]|nr:hypothetical protein [Prolixibacteraceae bacterium]